MVDDLSIMNNETKTDCLVNNLNMMQSKKSVVNTYMRMTLCYTPMLIVGLIFILFHEHLTTLWALQNSLVFLNSSINPFL